MRRAVALLAALPLAVPALALAAKDPAITALNIIPSGQLGAVPPPAGADKQALMYDALTPLFDQVGPGDLRRDFKSEAFNRIGTDGPGKVETSPRKGIRIVRDKYDVPHVTAKSYDLGIWAAGWIAAEDRTLLLEQARFNSRVAAIGAPGLPALTLISSLRTFEPSAQTEAIVARQSAVLRRAGREGRRVLHDIDTFCAGINAQYRKAGSTAKPWTRNDVFALTALKGQFVGQGGGDEARRTQFLSALQARLGADPGLQVFNDLRQHDDPEQPASIGKRFPYDRIPSSRAGNVIIDPGSFIRTPAATLTTATPPASRQEASNELMVDAKHSTNHHPLLVGGPQIGYYYPGLTYEIDMNAPGLHWRGATSAPFPGYMLIGRGRDFAVTLTSAGADIIDQYAETLCGGSDTNYVYKGSCRAMDVVDAGVLKGTQGNPDQRVMFRQTVHGPVVGYATVNGTKVAISSKRSTYGRDAVDLLLYRRLSTGAVHSPKTFFSAAAKSPQTFNSFYIDARHIAEFTSGRLPLRPGQVDPGLLTNGNGDYEWRGFLKANAHPHQADPKSGFIVNWNNNIARGFGASDEDWMRAGAVSRVDLLNKNLRRLAKPGNKHTLATVTSAMNAGATQDIRAIDTVPLLARLLEGSTPPSPRAKQMLDLMVAWNQSGGSRLDRDLDGKVDDPGAAIMDGAWNKIADAFMAPVLGPNLDELATLVRRFDHPSIQGSTGQFSGWYQYFDKDIRALLGDTVRGPFKTQYCGTGDKARCQGDVWAAINAAGSELAQAQGTADPTAWRSDATVERIKFIPGLLTTTIRYTNRPTGIQQVISFR